MVALIERIDPDAVAARLARTRERIAEACARSGRDPAAVDVLVATKYLVPDQVPLLAGAGVTLVGENRAQALQEKVALPGAEALRWEFIGHLQSRKVPDVLPHVRRIHSVASDSVLRRLERHRDLAPDGFDVLLEVNVSGEDAKSGIAPDELPAYLERCPVPVAGLMTMPPFAEDPEDSRRWFSALRELAERHGLRELSMGTTQDHLVAVEEGATVVRLGSGLLRD
ncbi:YggS family pyridoxal phosphate-dependent enzyme [Patulibacter brassicae]|uniref:YggS family pyridoxal phosphate-dependent enzyme n=1 Tax=Patulibacter brassicae TaxID=1705717 RepID=A0ABU4VEP0_9ACTN|nr:YggS family pyridoxal phosphate-dependent enzyme [Patulibacter brassicae]MDX8150267.1 YggS family pyridoxal phosphate-dependent enzyme [Patulibacter brassicae]